jgi:nicotinate-nucleotide adenylyltransferase
LYVVQAKIGILGGSFDPIHYGHLAIADHAMRRCQLERILVIPAGHQPLKPSQHHATPQQRLAMAQLACREYPHLEVSAIEVERPGRSYTITTLETLAAQLPGPFALIIGADALIDFPKWHEPQRILSYARIIAVARPAFQINTNLLVERLPELLSKLTIITGPDLAVSSTMIRQRIRQQQSIHGLTPPAVIGYIQQQKLYQQ